MAQSQERSGRVQLLEYRGQLRRGWPGDGYPERRGVFVRPVPEPGEPALRVARRGREPQGGAPRMIGTGPAGGSRTQLAAGAGKGGQQIEVDRGAVAADEMVQGDTGRKIFQNEEPGRYVGGDNARGQRESQIVGQEPQRGRDLSGGPAPRRDGSSLRRQASPQVPRSRAGPDGVTLRHSVHLLAPVRWPRSSGSCRAVTARLPGASARTARDGGLPGCPGAAAGSGRA